MMAVSYYKPITQDITGLKEVWQTIDLDSCPLLYNFHMHTVFSDGKLEPTELIRQAIEIGLQGLAITDHHSVGGYLQAQEYLSNLHLKQSSVSSLRLWTGMEITSRLNNIEVHILGYGFDPEHPALNKYLQGSRPEGKDAEAKRVIDTLHEAGGLVVLAHPERYRRPAQELIPLVAKLGIDGVETYYAYNNPQPWKPSPKQTKKVNQLALEYNLYQTCGTDSHGLSLLRRI